MDITWSEPDQPEFISVDLSRHFRIHTKYWPGLPWSCIIQYINDNSALHPVIKDQGLQTETFLFHCIHSISLLLKNNPDPNCYYLCFSSNLLKFIINTLRQRFNTMVNVTRKRVHLGHLPPPPPKKKKKCQCTNSGNNRGKLRHASSKYSDETACTPMPMIVEEKTFFFWRAKKMCTSPLFELYQKVSDGNLLLGGGGGWADDQISTVLIC